MKLTHKLLPLLSCLMLASSCEGVGSIVHPGSPDLIDPARNLTREDYRNFTNPDFKKEGDVSVKTGNSSEPPVPDLLAEIACCA